MPEVTMLVLAFPITHSSVAVISCPKQRNGERTDLGSQFRVQANHDGEDKAGRSLKQVVLFHRQPSLMLKSFSLFYTVQGIVLSRVHYPYQDSSPQACPETHLLGTSIDLISLKTELS